MFSFIFWENSGDHELLSRFTDLWNTIFHKWNKRFETLLRVLILSKRSEFPHFLQGKCQLISKCLFGVFNFSHKTNNNKSTWGIIVLKLNIFVRFLRELRIPKSSFEINWPLPKHYKYHLTSGIILVILFQINTLQ